MLEMPPTSDTLFVSTFKQILQIVTLDLSIWIIVLTIWKYCKLSFKTISCKCHSRKPDCKLLFSWQRFAASHYNIDKYFSATSRSKLNLLQIILPDNFLANCLFPDNLLQNLQIHVSGHFAGSLFANFAWWLKLF